MGSIDSDVAAIVRGRRIIFAQQVALALTAKAQAWDGTEDGLAATNVLRDGALALGEILAEVENLQGQVDRLSSALLASGVSEHHVEAIREGE